MPLAPCFQGIPKSRGDAKIPKGCLNPCGMSYSPVKFTWCSKPVWRILDKLGLNSRVIFTFSSFLSSVLVAKEEECN